MRAELLMFSRLVGWLARWLAGGGGGGTRPGDACRPFGSSARSGSSSSPGSAGRSRLEQRRQCDFCSHCFAGFFCLAGTTSVGAV